MENQPIKRLGYMVALTRDHHHCLLFSWKIKEGLRRGVSINRIAEYARFFWEEHLRRHFQEEELLLLNQHKSELTLRGKKEQVGLRNIFEQIANGEEEEPNYFSLAEKLVTHVRFEERELFPYLEKMIITPVLNDIRDILDRLHREPFEEKYFDEFWIK